MLFRSVTMTIENNQFFHLLARGRRPAYLDHTNQLVSYAQARNCGLTFDTCHAAASGEDLLATGDLMRPLLRNVHLHDMVWRRGQPHTHLVPGDGVLPLGELLQRLAASGYAGLITVELHPREIGWLGPWSMRRATRLLARALDFMRAATGVITSAQVAERL